MPVPAASGESSDYFARFFSLVRLSTVQLSRPSSHPQATAAARRSLRQATLLVAIGAIAVISLMYGLDAWEISLMPPRGTASLWPVRIVTDFGKAANVLWTLAVMLFAVALVLPALRGAARSRLMRLGTDLQFLFFAVLVPVLAGEVIKWIVGRGRPFVGGKANAFNFEHFAGTEAYASFPSAHAITSAALAFAVSAVWPQARAVMIVYALLIAGSRLVLLAHHPSDVVAGALIGVVGAMFVRYWFAARRLGFVIGGDGVIAPPIGPRLGSRFGLRKGVAREASAP
ncbi:phosphatase PAP2 family protein [Bradyrhizobium canariense]|uniref:Undecaprenyl-diphosphatase n=1 Tax=Bradyrhizobium canariense TaxID=255045 RepID=A0A1H1QPX0_9BRAD|nr:phosphatase PAP2 family protein [Bradyrhizobium canariense]SDS25383.1 undecaprenyl-diphosphatase [Bradyrhizobium canariense]